MESSIVHNFDFCRDPCMIILPLWNMYNLFLSNNAVHPASHSCPMDNREPDARCGNTCTFRASGGKFVMFNIAVCVDCIRAALGNMTSMPLCVGCISVSGRFTLMYCPIASFVIPSPSKKCPVAPVSATIVDVVLVVPIVLHLCVVLSFLNCSCVSLGVVFMKLR